MKQLHTQIKIVLYKKNLKKHLRSETLKIKKCAIRRIFLQLGKTNYFALRAGNFSRIRAALPDNSRR